MYGARLIFSMPPATTTSAVPAQIAWAASPTVSIPVPLALFTVYVATSMGSPASSTAFRAGPKPRVA